MRDLSALSLQILNDYNINFAISLTHHYLSGVESTSKFHLAFILIFFFRRSSEELGCTQHYIFPFTLYRTYNPSFKGKWLQTISCQLPLWKSHLFSDSCERYSPGALQHMAHMKGPVRHSTQRRVSYYDSLKGPGCQRLCRQSWVCKQLTGPDLLK